MHHASFSLLGTVVVAAAALVGCMQGDGGMGGHAMTSSPRAAEAPFDLQFLDTMTAHHQSAIEMAQLASKARHEELKRMANGIVEAQQNEIAQMKVWRATWFADNAPAMNMEMPGMTGSMKPMHMKKLRSATGDAVDRHFIEGMIPHHEGAVAMCNAAAPKLEHQELKTLCQRIVASQSTEIAEMKRLQSMWFSPSR